MFIRSIRRVPSPSGSLQIRAAECRDLGNVYWSTASLRGLDRFGSAYHTSKVRAEVEAVLDYARTVSLLTRLGGTDEQVEGTA